MRNRAKPTTHLAVAAGAGFAISVLATWLFADDGGKIGNSRIEVAGDEEAASDSRDDLILQWLQSVERSSTEHWAEIVADVTNTKPHLLPVTIYVIAEIDAGSASSAVGQLSGANAAAARLILLSGTKEAGGFSALFNPSDWVDAPEEFVRAVCILADIKMGSERLTTDLLSDFFAHAVANPSTAAVIFEYIYPHTNTEPLDLLIAQSEVEAAYHFLAEVDDLLLPEDRELLFQHFKEDFLASDTLAGDPALRCAAVMNLSATIQMLSTEDLPGTPEGYYISAFRANANVRESLEIAESIPLERWTPILAEQLVTWWAELDIEALVDWLRKNTTKHAELALPFAVAEMSGMSGSFQARAFEEFLSEADLTTTRMIANEIIDKNPAQAWSIYLATLKDIDERRNISEFTSFFNKLARADSVTALHAYREIAAIDAALSSSGSRETRAAQTLFSQTVSAANAVATHATPDSLEGVRSALADVDGAGKRVLAYYFAEELIPRDFDAAATAINVLEEARKTEFFSMLLRHWGKDWRSLEASGITRDDIENVRNHSEPFAGYERPSWQPDPSLVRRR